MHLSLPANGIARLPGEAPIACEELQTVRDDAGRLEKAARLGNESVEAGAVAGGLTTAQVDHEA